MRNKVLEEKIEKSKQVLTLAADMSKEYYQKPLIITYSGGKDSDVLLQLAIECLAPSDFEVLNSHTTVDAPETVYYIRDRFKELEEMGVKATIKYPHYEDGRFKSIWTLIEDRQIPPTRLVRYCCAELKEVSTPNRFIALGVRSQESTKRKGRDIFSPRSTNKNERYWYSYEHTREVFDDDRARRGGEVPSNEEGVWDCKLISTAKKNEEIISNPIYEWTDSEVWEFIHERNMKYNPLYDQGFYRVGCIGCPMASNQVWELEKYPKYKQNYIKAFERMLKKRKALGKDDTKGHWKDAESTYKWWIGDNSLEGQMDIFDFMGEEDGKTKV